MLVVPAPIPTCFQVPFSGKARCQKCHPAWLHLSACTGLRVWASFQATVVPLLSPGLGAVGRGTPAIRRGLARGCRPALSRRPLPRAGRCACFKSCAGQGDAAGLRTGLAFPWVSGFVGPPARRTCDHPVLAQHQPSISQRPPCGRGPAACRSGGPHRCAGATWAGLRVDTGRGPTGGHSHLCVCVRWGSRADPYGWRPGPCSHLGGQVASGELPGKGRQLLPSRGHCGYCIHKVQPAGGEQPGRSGAPWQLRGETEAQGLPSFHWMLSCKTLRQNPAWLIPTLPGPAVQRLFRPCQHAESGSACKLGVFEGPSLLFQLVRCVVGNG